MHDRRGAEQQPRDEVGRVSNERLGLGAHDAHEARVGQHGQLLAGRQVLWLLYQEFKSDKYTGNRNTIADLAAIPWYGDNPKDILRFRNTWGEIAANMEDGVTDNIKAGTLLQRMRDSKVMKEKVAKYARTYQYSNSKPTQVATYIGQVSAGVS